MQAGKVYLIGAGPGDPGLLTIKGKECLEKADIVIYDYLANKKFLEYVRPQAERVYVGKKSGQHTMTQDDINTLLVESAKKYSVVVRLKGGDPFLFGRGGEEALELVKNNIPFEVVPGISSGMAAAAYAGIPVTHRGLSTSVVFLTGHEAPQKTAESASVDWKGIAKSCDTLVIFMGVKNLPNITKDLLAAGLDKNTPVAVIREGTYNSQYTLTGTLQTIVHQAEERQLKPPSIIIIGNVVTLTEHLNWFERRPLFGKTIVVTRNISAEATLIGLLEQQGADIFHFPTIDIVAIQPNKELDEAIMGLEAYDWVLFTSGNAVEIFFDRLFQRGDDIRSLHAVKIAAIGRPSARKLAAYHLNADFVPETFTSEKLVSGMKAEYSLVGKRILFPGSSLSNPDIARDLREAGATVDTIAVYETQKAQHDVETIDRLKALIQEKKIHWMTFTSSSTVDNFVEIVGHDFITSQSDELPVASIGPVTTATLEKYGMQPRIRAEKHTFEGLVNSIIQGEQHG